MLKWLKEIRIGLGLSQKQVALAANISQQYYGHIESGFRGKKLPVATAMAIAAVLHFDWKRFYDDGQANDS